MTPDDLNAPRYRGLPHVRHRRGHYEAWYLTLALPEAGQAFWFRYTVEARKGGRDAAAGLWAFAFDKQDARAGASLHDRYLATRFVNKTTPEKGFKIEVGPGVLERGKAKGKVGTGASTIEWDLKFEPRGPSLEHFSPALYAIGVARSLCNAPHLALEVDGTVKVAGRTIKLQKAPGEQGHVFGRKHATQWAWAHCNAFAEEKDAIFEGVSAKVRRYSIALPTVTPIYLRARGKEHVLTSTASMLAHDSRFELGRWDFEAEDEEILVMGRVQAPPERFVSVEYRDPDGEKVYCNNCCLADMSLELYERVGARWEPAGRLTSSGTTAFEIADGRRDPRVQRKLDLAEARAAE